MKSATFALCGLTALTGCATIMQGPMQDVGFASTPTGASITVDHKPCGVAPTLVTLSRNATHVVRIEMPGYQPYETTLTRSVSGWVWGNIVFGGPIGLAVDAISGSLYKLTPEQISGTLVTKTAKAESDNFTVAVVLFPDSSWQKVGQLIKR